MDLENKLPRHPANTAGLSHEFGFDNAYLYVAESDYPALKLNKIIFNYDTVTHSNITEMRFTTMAKALLKDILTDEFHFYKKQVRLES